MKPTELQARVYQGYYNLMSDEMREEIKTYTPLPKPENKTSPGLNRGCFHSSLFLSACLLNF